MPVRPDVVIPVCYRGCVEFCGGSSRTYRPTSGNRRLPEVHWLELENWA